MKIGILTILYNSTNYGGCLQAYALEKFLLDNGFDTEQILYCNNINSLGKNSLFKRVTREWKASGLKGVIKKIILIFKVKIEKTKNNIIGKIINIESLNKKRCDAFINFRDNVIIHTEKVYNNETINECDDFDVYITGSDEVWRLNDDTKLNAAYWLTFVHSNEKRKISYAASLSMSAIPALRKDEVKKALSDYTAISVRQNSDKRCIEELTDKSVEWVLDPTLLITSEIWNEVAASNKYSKQKYLFTYILGKSKWQRKCAERFAKDNNLKIINIPYLHNEYRSCDNKFGDYIISKVSPELWISLIRDAEYIFTDSFHGTVFSLLFHKKFYTFLRDSNDNIGSRNSRIYSLFEMFGIEDRLISTDISTKEILNKADIDYTNVEKILEKERKHSYDFLLNAINR